MMAGNLFFFTIKLPVRLVLVDCFPVYLNNYSCIIILKLGMLYSEQGFKKFAGLLHGPIIIGFG